MGKRIARIAFLALFFLAVTSCGHVGQRLLHIEIERDGKIAFEGIRGVPDNMPVEQMWDVLGDVPFETTADSLGTDVRTFALDGNVVVRIKHVDRELGLASLTTLSLHRDATSSSWRLSDGETGRVKQAVTN
jgi:hypothetical protein